MIDHLDHLFLTTTDAARSIDFYTRVLGMQLERFGVSAQLPDGRIAFRFGNQKINLHVKGGEFNPKAHLPVPGALDLCFIAAIPLDEMIAGLAAAGVTLEADPGPRTGAIRPIRSVYVRDPDLNLIDISEYLC